MADTKKYLRGLLNTAISSTSGEVVNFRALRKLLEESIELCVNVQHSATEIKNQSMKTESSKKSMKQKKQQQNADEKKTSQGSGSFTETSSNEMLFTEKPFENKKQNSVILQEEQHETIDDINMLLETEGEKLTLELPEGSVDIKASSKLVLDAQENVDQIISAANSKVRQSRKLSKSEIPGKTSNNSSENSEVGVFVKSKSNIHETEVRMSAKAVESFEDMHEVQRSSTKLSNIEMQKESKSGSRKFSSETDVKSSGQSSGTEMEAKSKRSQSETSGSIERGIMESKTDSEHEHEHSSETTVKLSDSLISPGQQTSNAESSDERTKSIQQKAKIGREKSELAPENIPIEEISIENNEQESETKSSEESISGSLIDISKTSPKLSVSDDAVSKAEIGESLTLDSGDESKVGTEFIEISKINAAEIDEEEIEQQRIIPNVGLLGDDDDDKLSSDASSNVIESQDDSELKTERQETDKGSDYQLEDFDSSLKHDIDSERGIMESNTIESTDGEHEHGHSSETIVKLTDLLFSSNQQTSNAESSDEKRKSIQQKAKIVREKSEMAKNVESNTISSQSEPHSDYEERGTKIGKSISKHEGKMTRSSTANKLDAKTVPKEIAKPRSISTTRRDVSLTSDGQSETDISDKKQRSQIRRGKSDIIPTTHRTEKSHTIVSPRGDHKTMSKVKTEIGTIGSNFKTLDDFQRIVGQKDMVKKVHEMTLKSKKIDTVSEKLKKFKQRDLLNLALQNDEICDFTEKRPVWSEELHSNCSCSALVNSNRCECDPKICQAEKATDKAILCFCVKSFVRGTDGSTYHTTCNCTGNR